MRYSFPTCLWVPTCTRLTAASPWYRIRRSPFSWTPFTGIVRITVPLPAIRVITRHRYGGFGNARNRHSHSRNRRRCYNWGQWVEVDRPNWVVVKPFGKNGTRRKGSEPSRLRRRDGELGLSPIRISHIDRIIIDISIEVGPARVANRVTVDEPPCAGVVVAVPQQRQARLRVRVVAPPALEARVGVGRAVRACPQPEGVLAVGLAAGPVAGQPSSGLLIQIS